MSREDLLIHLLLNLHRNLSGHMSEVFRRSQIPFAVMAVTGALHKEPGLTVSDLARRTGIAKSHISNTVAGLVRQGMVERHADPEDQRLGRLYLTEAFSHRFAEMDGAIREELRELVAAIPAEEAETVVAGLQILHEALSGLRDSGRGGSRADICGESGRKP